MIFLNKEIVNRDVKKAKLNGYFQSLNDFYKRVPKTKCMRCGGCCKDSPEISYSEFLYIYDYMKNHFDDNTNIQLITKGIRTHMYGLLEPGRSCCMLDDNKRCIIYERAPMSCKFWGLYSFEEYNRNIESDKKFNDEFKKHYESDGIMITDEVINFKVPYCNNVSVCEEEGKNFDFGKLNEYGLKKIWQTNKIFTNMQMRGCSIGDYLSFLILGEKAYSDRLKLTKRYQSGESTVIDDYINELKKEDLKI